MDELYASGLEIFLFQPDEVLGKLVGMARTTSYQLERDVLSYFMKNGLWDKDHPGVVRSDEFLKPLFDGKDEISATDLWEWVFAHVAETGVSANASPSTYLLTWNPRKWHWANLEECVAETRAFGELLEPWSCGRSKRIKTGDRVFLNRQGVEPKGIMASGTAVSDVFEENHWDSAMALRGRSTYYVEVEWEIIIDPEKELLLQRETLRKDFPQVNWDTQMSGIRIDDTIVERLEENWNSHVARLGTYRPITDETVDEDAV